MSVRPADENSRQQAYFVGASEAFQTQRNPDELFPQLEPPINPQEAALGAGGIARRRFAISLDPETSAYDLTDITLDECIFDPEQENFLGSNIGPRPFPLVEDPMPHVSMLSLGNALRSLPTGELSTIEFSGQVIPLHFADAGEGLPVIGNEVYHLMRMRRFFKNACPEELSCTELNTEGGPKPSKTVSRIQMKFDELPGEIQDQIYLEIARDANQNGDKEFGRRNLFTDFARFVRATDRLPILQEALRLEKAATEDASSPEDEEFRPMLAGDRV